MQKWLDPGTVEGLLAGRGLSGWLVWPALVFNLAAGVLLALGLWTRPLALLLAAYVAGTVAWAARWRALLRLGGVRMTLGEAWRTSVEAQAGGVVLPGGFGGDALRIAFVALAGLAALHHERLAARGGALGRLDPLVHYETSSYGPRAIDALVRVVGIDPLVLGTDRPYAQPFDATDLPGFGAAFAHALTRSNPAHLLEGTPR